MSEVKELKIDKSTWGEGPWQTEPDKLNWEHAGLDCMIVRQPRAGHLCGYVAVPPDHPFYGKSYDACTKGCTDCDGYEHSPGFAVDVHGGLTYADECQGRICHVPAPGRPDNVWWFGFDCAHSGDLSPASEMRLPTNLRSKRDQYRNIQYVKAVTERLAEQLAGIKARTQPPKAGEGKS